MFTIYYIPEKNKVGCTGRNPQRRVKEQGFTEFKILEVHSDKEIAGKRERELQKQYGCEIDRLDFEKIDYSNLGKKGGTNGKGYKPYNATKVIQIDINNNFICEFNTLHEASIKTKISRSNISFCCSNKRKTAGGYKWKYKK